MPHLLSEHSSLNRCGYDLLSGRYVELGPLDQKGRPSESTAGLSPSPATEMTPKSPVWITLFALATCVGFAGACGSEDTSRPKNSPQSTAGGGGAGGATGGGATAGTSSGTSGTGQPPVIGPGTGPVDSGPPSSPDAACAAVNQQAETMKQPADIIWVLDNSGSMATEAAAVQSNMNIFAQQIIASGIDVRVVVLSAEQLIIFGIPVGIGICIAPPLGSGQCPADSLPPKYLHVPAAVGSHDALNLLIDRYRDYASMLRPNASKTFVVVTDDEATQPPNNSAAAFTAAVKALDPVMFAKWKLSGVYCSTPCLNCAGTGLVYEQLRQQTGGVSGDMCTTDFAPVFKALAESVIIGSKLACEWNIPPPPVGQTFDPGLVNVIYTPSGQTARDVFNVPLAADCGTQGGWFYDDAAKPTKILACPATCTEIQADMQAKIDVAFGCRTKPIVK
jgi:hypothetical protein